jgi:3-oxoacyl-[acyl-carrier protein] reductase
MNIDLTHLRAIVCGSTQGIGRATANSIAAAGGNVVLIARNQEKLAAVRDSLDTSVGQQHSTVAVDFSHPDQLAQAVAGLVENIGSFHILVNNTGGPPGGPVFSATLEAFETAFTQHLKCNHILAQAVVPGMRELGYGRIVNVISTSVKQPLDGLGVSNTIRGAVANWAKTMANELGPEGITVNNVLPGATATERLASIITAKANNSGKSEQEIVQAMKQSIPARRFADADEIAAAITFLASPLAGYINGVNLPVDGGRTRCL